MEPPHQLPRLSTKNRVGIACLIPAFTLPMSTVMAQDADELAKQLSNPVASLISVPFQNNFDFGGGRDDDGFRYTLNVQPVIPVSISEDWNMISRTILPILYQEDYVDDGGWDQTGLGDTLQSLFFSPKAPTASGMIWGVGPAFLLPTGTNDSLGSEKWGAGPTGLFLFQKSTWTYGVLANHIWDVAGDEDPADISSTFIQPFLAYGAGGGITYTVNTESTYDWEHEQWTVPVNFMVTKVTKLGGQMVSLGGGLKWVAEAPEGGADWGVRLNIVLLFPK